MPVVLIRVYEKMTFLSFLGIKIIKSNQTQASGYDCLHLSYCAILSEAQVSFLPDKSVVLGPAAQVVAGKLHHTKNRVDYFEEQQTASDLVACFVLQVAMSR